MRLVLHTGCFLFGIETNSIAITIPFYIHNSIINHKEKKVNYFLQVLFQPVHSLVNDVLHLLGG